MVSSSENSKSPFRGLECLRPFKRGERYVAVATKKIIRLNQALGFLPCPVSGAQPIEGSVGPWERQGDRRSAVVLFRSWIVLLVSRQVSGLSQDVNDCRRDHHCHDDECSDG